MSVLDTICVCLCEVGVGVWTWVGCLSPPIRNDIVTRDVEAIDRFRFGGWDSYQYLYYKMEAEAEAEAVEAALKSTASTSLVLACKYIRNQHTRSLIPDGQQRFGSGSGSGSGSGGSGTFLEQLEAEAEALLKD